MQILTKIANPDVSIETKPWTFDINPVQDWQQLQPAWHFCDICDKVPRLKMHYGATLGQTCTSSRQHNSTFYWQFQWPHLQVLKSDTTMDPMDNDFSFRIVLCEQ